MGLKSKLVITSAAVLAIGGGGLDLAWARGQASPTPPAVHIINAGHAAAAVPQQVQPAPPPSTTTTAPTTTAPTTAAPTATSQPDADDAAPDNETSANEAETGASETETDAQNDAGAQDDHACPPNCDAAGEKD